MHKAEKATGVDWFARVTAILGLIVAGVAVLLPYFQTEADKREHLTIVAVPERPDGIIRLSADESKSQAVQIPWVVTLSNTGRTKLSVVSYQAVELIGDSGISSFPGLDGGLTDRMNKTVTLPLTLDAGESTSLRIYLGFIPTRQIAELLRSMYAARGRVTAGETFVALAEQGLTIYGGKATMREDDGARAVTIDAESQPRPPIYGLICRTGRNQEFSTTIQEYRFNQ